MQALRQNTDLTKTESFVNMHLANWAKTVGAAIKAESMTAGKADNIPTLLIAEGAHHPIAVARNLVDRSLIDCKVFIALEKRADGFLSLVILSAHLCDAVLLLVGHPLRLVEAAVHIRKPRVMRRIHPL
jgi:hypothetical protein